MNQQVDEGVRKLEHYDLCILSTRQDEEVAHRLGDSIRQYRLPKNVKLPDASLDYRRILYDCCEEPLNDEIRAHLDSSRYMALICSPATKHNSAILERLEIFRRDKGQEQIVAVIADGEPIDAFPESFIETKTVQHILPDMTVVERTETVEPVAADLRGATEKRRREVLRYETVRITASILGLHPDDLEQRHRARRRHTAAIVLAVVGSVCLAAAGIFTRLGLIARTEGKIAEEQTELSVSVARRTMVELPASFAGEEQALSYIDEAVENARTALDELGLGELLDEAEEEGVS